MNETSRESILKDVVNDVIAVRLTIEDVVRIPYNNVKDEIISFIREFDEKHGFNKYVIGLSGGIDSSVAYRILVEALPRDKILTLIMPDKRVTPPNDTLDAIELARQFGVDYNVIEISGIVDRFLESIGRTGSRIAVGNLRARVRAGLLYFFANDANGVVVGTSDRSEILIGYYTKYGDGAADIHPIACLYKSQVRRLARELGLPREIYEKPSAPRLWENHLAEDELKIKYEDIDLILYALFDLGLTIDDTVNATGLPREIVQRVVEMHVSSRHKRRLFNVPAISIAKRPIRELEVVGEVLR